MVKGRLEEKYLTEIRPILAGELDLKNPMAIPEVVKVVVNVGLGKILKNKEAIASLEGDIAKICGQKPSLRRAKVSVASFGIRAGMTVGMAVTLRGEKMYAFLDRLFTTVLPRLRDFRGVSLKGFDRSGNYTLGLAEHTVFPEVDAVKSSPYGMEITIVTSTKDTSMAQRLLALLGMPFEKKGDEK